MSTKKLIGILSIFLVIGIAFSATNVKAHKPMHIDFNYDADNDILKLTFIHGVTDPTVHFVESIEILINSSNFVTVPYTSQPTTNIFTYEYAGIDVAPGDNVTAIAICSFDGEQEMHLVWAYWEDKGSFSSVVVPTLISTIIVAIIVLLPAISQKLKKRK